MQAYTVTSGSVAVRSSASSSARITNVLPEGSTIYVVDEDSGWLRTSGGYYIFKTSNLALAAPKPTLRASQSSSYPPGSSLTNTTTYTPPPNTSGMITKDDINKKKQDEKPKTQEETVAETNTTVAPQDQTSSANSEANSQQRDSLLTNKYRTASIKITGVGLWENGKLVTDSNGHYKMGPVPADLDQSKLALSSIKEVNGKLYVISELPGGEQYVSELSTSELGLKDSKSGAIIYEKGTDIEKGSVKDPEVAKQEESLLDQIANIGSKIITSYTDLTNLTVEDSRIIHGMPYQFMPIVDPRLVKGQEISAFNAFGRKFNEKIVARAPILYMQAGLPIFMRGYSDEAKKSMFDSLVSQIESSDDDELNKLLDDQNAQYYSFGEQSNLYFKAVNSACTALAHLLQIESVQIDTLQPRDSSTDKDSWGQTISQFLNPKSLGNINWALRTSHSLGFYRGAVAFYINSENQIQETFVNSTRKSAIANKINSASDISMEAAFLVGGMSNNFNFGIGEGVAQALYADRNKNIGNGNQKEYLGSSFLGSLVNNLTNLIAGGKMVIPEIWADSQFQRSYNVSIQLNTPDSDTVSIFLNILVPLLHILGFVLPRSAGPNMYASPFLVRCFYKSTFHIDMGIIKSCTITKGDTGAWNCDGLPTQITIELTIADLYDRMSQASGINNNTLISNPAQLEYLANLAGVNIAPANFARALELWYAVKGFRRMKEGLVGSAGDMMQSVFRKLQELGQSNPRYGY